MNCLNNSLVTIGAKAGARTRAGTRARARVGLRDIADSKEEKILLEEWF